MRGQKGRRVTEFPFPYKQSVWWTSASSRIYVECEICVVRLCILSLQRNKFHPLFQIHNFHGPHFILWRVLFFLLCVWYPVHGIIHWMLMATIFGKNISLCITLSHAAVSPHSHSHPERSLNSCFYCWYGCWFCIGFLCTMNTQKVFRQIITYTHYVQLQCVHGNYDEISHAHFAFESQFFFVKAYCCLDLCFSIFFVSISCLFIRIFYQLSVHTPCGDRELCHEFNVHKY